VKTYPAIRRDGKLLAFEITSTWVTFGPLYRVLRSVDGVANLKRNWFNDDRVSFTFHGEPFVVNEPWGDNSRYWIGPKAPEAASLDVSPICAAFEQHRGPMARAWSKLASRQR
jgi:hypothetical protein